MHASETFGESSGLIIRKILAILWFLLPLFVVSGILMAVASSNSDTPTDTPLAPTEESSAEDTLQLKDVKFRVDSYYEHVDMTYFDLQLEFDRPVYAGYVTVAFYDANGTKTDEQELRLTPRNYGTTERFLSVTFADAKGNVASCEIIDFSEITYPSNAYMDDDYDYDYDGLAQGIVIAAVLYDVIALGLVWAFLRLLYVLPIVGTALFFNCKTYFVSGHYLTVYTGRFNHYVKVDGVRVEEKSCLIPTSHLSMSVTVSGYTADVSIHPLTRRITVKVNNTLQMPI